METDRIERVLVATDGSKDSMEAARYAARLAALGTRITVVHVAPPADFPLGTTQLGMAVPEPGPEDDVSVVRTVWEGSQAIVDAAMGMFDRSGLTVEGMVQEGEAAEEILKLAEESGFDLIVIGRRGADESEDSMGSTATEVVRSAVCPVLVVGNR